MSSTQQSKKKLAVKTVIAAVVFLLVVWSLFPLIYIGIVSCAGPAPLPASLQLPEHLTLANWAEVVYVGKTIWPYMFNSLIVASVTAALTLCVTLPAAYSLSRYRTRLSNAIFITFLFFRTVPFIVLIIPTYFMLRRYGVLGSRIGLSLSYLVYTVPLSIWLMRGYFDMLSPEMEEAALIDGANRFHIFWKISVPLSAPGIAVTMMFAFLFCYIELLFAVVITSKATSTLSVYLSSYMAIHEVYWRPMACSAIISLIPMIVLFIFLQKHLARGLTLGAVK